MKRTKNLLILAIVLVLLSGGYAYISTRPKKAAATTPDKSVQLLKLDKASITKIVLKSKDGTLEIEKNGDKWAIPSLQGDKLQADLIDGIAASFASLTADKVVSESLNDAGKYGLSPAVVEATAVLSDGSEKTVYLGNSVPGNTGYYGTLKGDSKIYVLPTDSGTNFSYKAVDLRDKLLTSLVQEDETYIKIIEKDGKTIEINKAAKDTPDAVKYGEGTWLMKKPYKDIHQVDTSKSAYLYSAFTNIRINEFIEDHATDLSKYGLDKPSLEVIGKDSKNAVHLIFGNDKDENSVYFMTADSNNVYTMDKEFVGYYKVNPFDMISKFVDLEFIDNVDSVLVEGLGQKHEMAITRKTQKNADGQDETTATYKLDGKDMEEHAFKTLYQSVIGLSVDSETDKQVEGNPEVTVTYNRNQDPKQVVITFVPYDSNFYAVFNNGNNEFLISKSQVSSMLQDLQNAAAGK